jgi:hypothetical protein
LSGIHWFTMLQKSLKIGRSQGLTPGISEARSEIPD